MALTFPDSSESPFEAPNGVTYVWNTDGYWEASGNNLGDVYLSKKNDDTAAGAITFEGVTTHEADVKVMGGSIDVQSNLSITGSSFISGAPQAAIKLGHNQGNNSDIGSWTSLVANTGKLQVVSRQDSSGGGSWWEFQMEPGNEKNMYQFVGVQSGTEERIKLGTNGNAYFKGDITCDGLINGSFSLRMETDDPDAFQTTYTTETDEEGNEVQVENQEYIGTTEDLLSIIKDLRARVAALEAGGSTKTTIRKRKS